MISIIQSGKLSIVGCATAVKVFLLLLHIFATVEKYSITICITTPTKLIHDIFQLVFVAVIWHKSQVRHYAHTYVLVVDIVGILIFIIRLIFIDIVQTITSILHSDEAFVCIRIISRCNESETFSIYQE